MNACRRGRRNLQDDALGLGTVQAKEPQLDRDAGGLAREARPWVQGWPVAVAPRHPSPGPPRFGPLTGAEEEARGRPLSSAPDTLPAPGQVSLPPAPPIRRGGGRSNGLSRPQSASLCGHERAPPPLHVPSRENLLCTRAAAGCPSAPTAAETTASKPLPSLRRGFLPEHRWHPIFPGNPLPFPQPDAPSSPRGSLLSPVLR